MPETVEWRDAETLLTRVRRAGQVLVLDLFGRITIGSGDRVLRETVHKLQDRGHRRILVNLENVTYVDSVGLAELVACYRRLAEQRGDFKLLRPTGKLGQLLEATRLSEVFETYLDEREALLSF